ncbi:MAG TPA: hypothetical protein P5572_06515, partial [Phycisphaerae bacterium]|nr:hypothetical protein [Phycisphaerae bacterium]
RIIAESKQPPIIIIEGDHRGKRGGKIIFERHVTKDARFMEHRVITHDISQWGEEDCSLHDALDNVIASLRRKGMLAKATNLF